MLLGVCGDKEEPREGGKAALKEVTAPSEQLGWHGRCQAVTSGLSPLPQPKLQRLRTELERELRAREGAGLWHRGMAWIHPGMSRARLCSSPSSARLARARPPRRGCSQRLQHPRLCPEPAPACSGGCCSHRGCARPAQLRQGFNPKPPWDAENQRAGRSKGQRAPGAARDRERPLWLGGTPAWSPQRGQPLFWGGGRRSHTLPLSALTTAVSLLPTPCEFLSLPSGFPHTRINLSSGLMTRCYSSPRADNGESNSERGAGTFHTPQGMAGEALTHPRWS